MTSDKGRPPKSEDDLLDWFTVSYKTIYAAVGVLAVAVVGALWFYFVRPAPPAPPSPAAPPSTTTTARFISIEGSVKVKTVGTFEWVPADKNTILHQSDLVRTGPGAAAEISFFDNTVVHVRPDSLITIEETSEDPSTKQRKVAWHISSGEVRFDTARKNVPGSSIEASTPTVRTIAGEETHGGIRVADSGESDVKVFKGTGVLQTKTGQRSQLASGEGLKVDAAGKAGIKVALPEVPILLAPVHQTEISYRDPTRATTLLVWKAVGGAGSYHVMLDYSPYFNRPIVDNRRIKGTTVELQGLDVGTYYWRVAADSSQTEGDFSGYAQFSVVKPARSEAPPPMLVIDSLDVRTNILQVKGRTEPGATVTVNGQAVEVLGDGSFHEFITLDTLGKLTVVIRATGLGGGINEQRRPVMVGSF
jgi:hypothetical protein